MDKQRTIIIGDVHGCLEELKELLQKVSYKKKQDRLIFVGDLINKGPDSFGVLSFVKELEAEVVQGNHERAFLKYLESSEGSLEVWDDLAEQIAHRLEEFVDWMKSWPYFIEESDFIVVHGGIAPGLHPSKVDPRILTTIRTWDGVGDDLKCEENPAWYDFYSGEKLVIFGHWAKRGLVRGANYIGLDSGCVYGNQLSALIFPENKVVQIDAKECYQVIK